MRRWLLAGMLAIATVWGSPAVAQDLTGNVPAGGILPGLENAPPFKAEVVLSGGIYERPTQFRIAYSPKKIRMESEDQVFITRLDRGVVYMYQGDNTWMELSLNAAGASGLRSSHRVTKQGTAVVDGRTCDVYVSTSDDGTRSTMYLAGGLPVRAKVDGPQGSYLVQYRSLVKGAVDERLFEVPRDAEVMNIQSLLNGLRSSTLKRPAIEGLD